MKSFGSHDHNLLQMTAKYVFSVIGTIAEQYSMQDFPVATPRFSIKRAGAMDTEAILSCGHTADNFVLTVKTVIKLHSECAQSLSASVVIRDYCITNTYQQAITSTVEPADLFNQWDDI